MVRLLSRALGIILLCTASVASAADKPAAGSATNAVRGPFVANSNEVITATADETPTKSLGWQQGKLAYTRVDLHDAIARSDIIVLAETTGVESRHTDVFFEIKPRLLLKGVLKDGANAWGNFLVTGNTETNLLFMTRPNAGEDWRVDAIFRNATARQVEAVKQAIAGMR